MFGVLTELRRYAADVPLTAVGACCRRRHVHRGTGTGTGTEVLGIPSDARPSVARRMYLVEGPPAVPVSW